MKTQEEKFRDITEAPLYPLLWKMAIPSMIGMIVTSVYSATDTFFIGKLNRTELTASVGIVFSFISMIQAVGFWFGYGAGNYVSRQLGQRDTDEADSMTSIGLALAVITGLVIMTAGMILIKPLAVLLGANTSAEALAATVSYLRITLISVPIMLSGNVLYNVLRLQGSAKDSMTGISVGMVLNMLLDPVFILVLDMGVAGAALASLIGQTAGTAILIMKMGKNGNTRIRLSLARLDIFHIKQILAGGAPNFCRQGITSVSGILLNNIAGAYGEAAIAGMTIAMRILQMGYALVIGFGQGFQPICTINYGASKYDRIRTAFRYALITATAALSVFAVIFFLEADAFAGVFSEKSDVCGIASDILRAMCIPLPFMGIYILIGMFLQNIGRFGKATLVTVAESGIFLIPSALMLTAVLGYTGLVWCKPVSSVSAVIFAVLISRKTFKYDLKEAMQ